MFYFLLRIKFSPLSLTLEVSFLKFCSIFLSPILSVLHFMRVSEKEKKSLILPSYCHSVRIFSQGRWINISIGNLFSFDGDTTQKLGTSLFLTHRGSHEFHISIFDILVQQLNHVVIIWFIGVSIQKHFLCMVDTVLLNFYQYVFCLVLDKFYFQAFKGYLCYLIVTSMYLF